MPNAPFTGISENAQLDSTRIVHFSQGLLGMPDCKNWGLVAYGQGTAHLFYSLQSTDHPGLKLIVTEPSQFVPQYRVEIDAATMESVALSDLNDAVVLVIVNQQGAYLTANLQGPLLINAQAKTGRQLVLNAGQYATRHVLCERKHVPMSLAA